MKFDKRFVIFVDLIWFFVLVTGIAFIGNGMSISYADGLAQGICNNSFCSCNVSDFPFWAFSSIIGTVLCFLVFWVRYAEPKLKEMGKHEKKD